MRITKDPQGYWFSEGDTKVLFYQAERKALPDGQAARSNYFHPLYDLDGNVLTEDFPKDHIHHRGIFWAWHQVRINGTTVQDQWVNRESFWTVRDARTAPMPAPPRSRCASSGNRRCSRMPRASAGLILRYRIVLHRGELAPADIKRLQSEYAAERIAQ